LKLLGIAAIGLLLLAVCALVGGRLYYERFANPRVARELLDQPDGERARKVMLLTLPSGRQVPVNYFLDGNMLYAGADGRWWKELVGGDVEVQALVRGETLTGRARAVRDDPAYTERIFRQLRPNAIKGFGTLVEIRLEASSAPGA
jgi:hypothetical protein